MNQSLGLQASIHFTDHLPTSKVHKHGNVRVFYLGKLLLSSVLHFIRVDADHSLHQFSVTERQNIVIPDLHADHKILHHTTDNGNILYFSLTST